MSNAIHQFKQIFGNEGDLRQFHCPGRVNLIGEHIDYLGGCVMPAAISLGITATVRPSSTNTIRAYSTAFDGVEAIDLDGNLDARSGHWVNFLIGVIRNLRDQGLAIRGSDVIFDSDLPLGSGLSSSAAMEVLSYYMIWKLATDSEPDRLKMVRECQQIENEFIGVNCGIMDQFAVGFGKHDKAILLNCNSLEYEHVPLALENHTLLIIDSRKPRTLAESAYNQRRAECAEALGIIQRSRSILCLVEATLDDLELLTDPIHIKRAEHAITEQQRVLESQKVLQCHDLIRFGQLMIESHQSLKNDFEVSCAELDHIVNYGMDHTGCSGIRMTGAGFGGCCVAVVENEELGSFSDHLMESFELTFGKKLVVYKSKLTDGVHEII